MCRGPEKGSWAKSGRQGWGQRRGRDAMGSGWMRASKVREEEWVVALAMLIFFLSLSLFLFPRYFPGRGLAWRGDLRTHRQVEPEEKGDVLIASAVALFAPRAAVRVLTSIRLFWMLVARAKNGLTEACWGLGDT